jgi:L-lactate utilization protein LutB
MAETIADLARSLGSWFESSQVERVIKALGKNGFKAQFATDGGSAVKAIGEMISDGATVGVGGSVTLHQIGFFDAMKHRNIELINPFAEGVAPEQRGELLRRTLTCDCYLCGTNAVTEEGHLFNIDGTGNRVAAMIFGPKKTIIVCGVNKITRDMTEARKRVWQKAAPMNAKRLDKKTPCAKTGFCSDCSSPDRICNASVELVKKPPQSDIHVVIVGEHLGL